MSRSERLIQLMQLLRTLPPPVRSDDLARELSVSPRSIYRDIDSLRKTGAVIDGEAGFGYRLVEDPALPPMMFSRDEMEALVLGLREVREVGDPVLAVAAQNALSKLRACLPPSMQQQFENAVLYAKRFHERPPISIDVAELRAATWDEWIVEMAYADQHGAETKRRVKPLSIVFLDQALVLLSWCTLREDFRMFRVDRIQKLTVTDESFRPHRARLLRDCLAQLQHSAPA